MVCDIDKLLASLLVNIQHDSLAKLENALLVLQKDSILLAESTHDVSYISRRIEVMRLHLYMTKSASKAKVTLQFEKIGQLGYEDFVEEVLLTIQIADYIARKRAKIKGLSILNRLIKKIENIDDQTKGVINRQRLEVENCINRIKNI